MIMLRFKVASHRYFSKEFISLGMTCISSFLSVSINIHIYQRHQYVWSICLAGVHLRISTPNARGRRTSKEQRCQPSAAICDPSIVVAYGHNELAWPPTTNSLSVTSKMLWPSATTNWCDHKGSCDFYLGNLATLRKHQVSTL